MPPLWPVPQVGIKGVGTPWLEILCCGRWIRYPEPNEVSQCTRCGSVFVLAEISRPLDPRV